MIQLANIFNYQYIMLRQKQIFSQFQLLGYMKNSQLTQYQFNKSLDKLLEKNASIYGFDREVSHQIWNKTQKQEGDEQSAWLVNLIDTIIQAQEIVRQNVKKQQQQIESGEMATQALVSCMHDDKHLSLAFGLKPYQSQKLSKIIYLQQSKAKSDNKQKEKNVSINQRQNQLARLESSPKLKNVMIITLGVILFQLFIMCHKNHFYNAIVELGIIMLVIGNFFGQTYNKFIIKLMIVGIVLDLVWLIVQAKNYWSPQVETIHSTMNTAFLKLVYLIVIFLLIPKVMIIIMLVQFWSVDRDYRKKVQIKFFKFQQIWIVDGKEQFNIVSTLLKGNHSNSANFPQ